MHTTNSKTRILNYLELCQNTKKNYTCCLKRLCLMLSILRRSSDKTDAFKLMKSGVKFRVENIQI